MNQVYQWPTYPAALHGMGVIMAHERDELAELFAHGVQALKQQDCRAAFNLWDSVWNDDGGGGAPGIFFGMTGSSFPQSVLLSAPPVEWEAYKAWLKDNETMVAFHADGIPSSSGEEGGRVYTTMVDSGDFCSNSSEIYADLFISSKLDVLIFSSTVDTLLGPPNTEAGVAATLDHAATISPDGDQARREYSQAPKQIWRVDSAKDRAVAGYSKCVHHPSGSNRLCFAVVRNAGHEMPAYQPRAALDLYSRFVAGRAWNYTGDAPEQLPSCAPCGGVSPFAGPSAAGCKAI
eukprot:TRINITY_DN3580_c0_g2_i7.p1 TRINITY_DN3580_c0_g2~~TRINITY_DN3580_c0_g2_i7.p1  ORF type:complete len:291 (+),score=51.18 TRINITY_DN3580_c0_g2_i7:809-1681(+)